jgi:peptide deformylase
MIIRSVTQVGNPVIRAKAKNVKSLTSPETRKIIGDLIDSMRHANLVGMAAPQIGIPARIFVTEIRKTTVRNVGETDDVRIFINPKILVLSKKRVPGYEGCGSVANAGIFGKVDRSSSVTITAFDKNGKKFTLRTEGLLARIIQHEDDHLNGIVFLDKVRDTKSLMSRGEYLERK